MARITALILMLFAAPVSAHDGFAFAGPDGHAPIGVHGDHAHETGEWMFSYRYMRMHMDGNRLGRDDISPAEITDPAGQGFTVAPLEMTTEMHMLGAMFAVSDRFTLMAMLPYVEKEMDHRVRNGTRFTTESSGIGDASIGGILRLHDTPRHSLLLNLGLSLPTGSIDERDDTPRCRMMGNCPAQLPYPMQLGSGTFDPRIGLTWRGDTGVWSWGTQALATFRLGRNDNDYSQGELFEASGWLARPVSENISLSARLAARDWNNYDGQDRELAVANTGFIPTAESDRRGGTRADIGLGMNWQAGGGLAGHRLAVELLYPVYQRLDGPQLESDGMLVVGWQYAP
ncbi:hypothetical protein RM531_09480 [Salinisphaera sp. P385]|uniref:Transporter n=1 Tax=Spectribacter acetivorans TaxID=3075603 RepID=A0ABU3B949_9GAMM|nr:transporter [Salinisphaera sp. P385]MDT0618708.1 hypothetical protein [Salinisphaera sp. P385]